MIDAPGAAPLEARTIVLVNLSLVRHENRAPGGLPGGESGRGQERRFATASGDLLAEHRAVPSDDVRG
jgi:hypothetical protein